MKDYLLCFALAASCTTYNSSRDEKSGTPPKTEKLQNAREENLSFPSGATYKLPDGFKNSLHDGYVAAENESGNVKFFLFENKDPDLMTSVAQCRKVALPNDSFLLQGTKEDYEEGFDKVLTFDYSENTKFIQARAFKKGEHNWIFLITAPQQEYHENTNAIVAFIK